VDLCIVLDNKSVQFVAGSDSTVRSDRPLHEAAISLLKLMVLCQALELSESLASCRAESLLRDAIHLCLYSVLLLGIVC
jgi:hypothetical protein